MTAIEARGVHFTFLRVQGSVVPDLVSLFGEIAQLSFVSCLDSSLLEGNFTQYRDQFTRNRSIDDRNVQLLNVGE